jgi:hypothetical protein
MRKTLLCATLLLASLPAFARGGGGHWGGHTGSHTGTHAHSTGHRGGALSYSNPGALSGVPRLPKH